MLSALIDESCMVIRRYEVQVVSKDEGEEKARLVGSNVLTLRAAERLV